MTSFAEVAKASLKHCCDSEDDDTTQDLPVPLLKH